jgi:hypothetical protein
MRFYMRREECGLLTDARNEIGCLASGRIPIRLAARGLGLNEGSDAQF